jgi:hypothetical protein
MLNDEQRVVYGRMYQAAWAQHASRDFRAAIVAYTALCETFPSAQTLTICLYGRGKAHLELDAYDAALADFVQAEALTDPRYTSCGAPIAQGICHWWLGQPWLAVEAWTRAGSASFQDLAGGVIPPALLLYAAERLDAPDLRKLAIALLRKHARRKLGAFPGQIVPMLLGRVDPADVEQAASRHDGMKRRSMCQADFYIGLHALRTGDEQRRAFHMRRSCSWDALPREDEHFLAKWEVARETL